MSMKPNPYSPTALCLIITLNSITELPETSFLSTTPSPFIKLSLTNNASLGILRSTTKSRTLEPLWTAEQFRFMPLDVDGLNTNRLVLSLYDKGYIGGSVAMGDAVLKLSRVPLPPVPTPYLAPTGSSGSSSNYSDGSDSDSSYSDDSDDDRYEQIHPPPIEHEFKLPLICSSTGQTLQFAKINISAHYQPANIAIAEYVEEIYQYERWDLIHGWSSDHLFSNDPGSWSCHKGKKWAAEIEGVTILTNHPITGEDLKGPWGVHRPGWACQTPNKKSGSEGNSTEWEFSIAFKLDLWVTESNDLVRIRRRKWKRTLYRRFENGKRWGSLSA
jgi:hypothetical protein